MYKLSVPISMETLTEEAKPLFARMLAECGVERVFLCCVGELYRTDCLPIAEPEQLRSALEWIRGLGMEAGVWVNTFGHGELLSHQSENERGDYTSMEDVDGRTAPVAYCPLDERFREDYSRGMKALAELKPDLIMLDDDLRFNPRNKNFSLTCFCKKHLTRYYDLIGEQLPREMIVEKIYSGGKNKYRDAFMDMMGTTLLDFALSLRQTVDSVDSTIRLGLCVSGGVWDFSGTDVIALAKALAGKTRPFARISGAPYHDPNIISIVEFSRQQCAWGKDSGVELFCEGDTYPRPRYNVPSRPLELFDLAMLADGSADGMLQYLFDYNNTLAYETGYARRLIRNKALRKQVAAAFAGKQAVGVQVFDVMHKFRCWELPEKVAPASVSWLQAKPSKGYGAQILSRNSIPTAYGPTDYPVLLMGENARHIEPAALKNGAILDVEAALILQSRGVDVGLRSVQEDRVQAEQFCKDGEKILNIDPFGKVCISCREGAQVESIFLPAGTPASYRYENSSGQRFFVMAFRCYAPGKYQNSNYLRSWSRRQQLAQAVQWLCGRTLPAYVDDAPETMLLTASDGQAMAVALLNLSLDELIEPVIRLDKSYTEIKCIDCAGRLEGDRVYLSTVSPFGFGAFEVK